MDAPSFEDELSFAIGAGTIVRLYRDELSDGWIDGRLAARGAELTLIAVIADLVCYNGFEIVVTDDITELEIPHPAAGFLEEALELRGAAAPAAPAVDLDSVAGCLESLREVAEVVTLFREEEDPDSMMVGRIAEIDGEKGELSLFELLPDAEWSHAPTRVFLREITRVAFAGGYEAALVEVTRARGLEAPRP